VTAPRRRSHPVPTEFSGETILLDEQRGANLRQVLSSLPSVIPRRVGNDYAEPTFLVRGLDPIQNRTFLEGIPLNDAQFNQGGASVVALENLSRVEFHPEGAPATYLEDGTGGATQLRLSNPEDEKVLGLSVRFGSLGFARGFGRVRLLRPRPAQIGIEYARSDENFRFFDDNGTPLNAGDDGFNVRKNNGFRRFTVFPQVRLLGDERRGLTFFGIGYSNQTEIPGPISIPTLGTLDQRGLLAALKFRAEPSETLSFESHAYARGNWENLRSDLPTEGLVPSDAIDFSTGARGELRWRSRSVTSTIAAGAKVDSYRSEIRNAEVGSRTNERFALPLAASVSFPLGNYAVVRPALLGHWYRYSTASASSLIPGVLDAKGPREFFLLSPRAGVFGRVFKRIQWRLSGGSFYRAPNMQEIYGAPLGVTPSPDLRVERALKGDLGFDTDFIVDLGPLHEVKLSYTYFLSRSHDLIAFTQNSQSTRVAVNVGESAISGHEAAVELKTDFELSVRLSGAYLSTENLSEVSYLRGKELPGRPAFRVSSVVGYRGLRWGAQHQFSWEGRSYWDLANTKSLAPWSEHGLSAYWDSHSFGVFYLEVRNLLDSITAASSLGSFETTDNNTGAWGYPAPGRRVYLSWKYEL